MADRRPALDEATLRETRDDLLTRVTEQQRRFGVLPDVKVAEEFIDPILRKVEVDHDADRESDTCRPAKAERPLPEGVFQKPMGTYVMGTPGAGARQVSGPPLPMEKPDSPNVAAARECFRRMRHHPDWRARVEKIAYATLSYVEREKQLKAVLLDYVRLHGDPRKPRPGKIIL